MYLWQRWIQNSDTILRQSSCHALEIVFSNSNILSIFGGRAAQSKKRGTTVQEKAHGKERKAKIKHCNQQHNASAHCNQKQILWWIVNFLFQWASASWLIGRHGTTMPQTNIQIFLPLFPSISWKMDATPFRLHKRGLERSKQTKGKVATNLPCKVVQKRVVY